MSLRKLGSLGFTMTRGEPRRKERYTRPRTHIHTQNVHIVVVVNMCGIGAIQEQTESIHLQAMLRKNELHSFYHGRRAALLQIIKNLRTDADGIDTLMSRSHIPVTSPWGTQKLEPSPLWRHLQKLEPCDPMRLPKSTVAEIDKN